MKNHFIMEKIFPIEITTQLNGRRVQAMIFESIANSENTGFRVRFDNGFEDNFFLAGEDRDLGPIGESEGWEPYATALKPDLLILSQPVEGQMFQIFRQKNDSVPTNICVTKEFPDQGLCEINLTLNYTILNKLNNKGNS